MSKMQNINDFTFWSQDQLYDLEDEWNLDDCDSQEGSSVNSPKEIKSIAVNMDDIEVSKRAVRQFRNQLYSNNSEIQPESFSLMKLNNLKYDKTVVKSASSDTTLDRKSLKSEISDLLRAWANAKKRNSNSTNNNNVQGSDDIFITMRQIPSLD